MVLTLEQINLLIQDASADPWIKKAREVSKLLRMHTYGEGVTEYLQQITGLESAAQIKLRQRYAISNKADRKSVV